MHYVSVGTSVKKVVEIGPGAMMAKVDIQHAYRNVIVHSD